MSTKPFKSYWLTKYALSEGIKVCDGSSFCANDNMIELSGYRSWQYFRLGKDVFDNEQDARKAAEAMRIKKIASLNKQLANLKKLEF